MVDLSIIVPVYNTEHFLPGCLDSICSQVFGAAANVEVWVINDGSLDNSQMVIDEYQRRYPNVLSVIQKKNGGVSEARNCGLDRATGRYVWFVDSDDSIEPHSIAEILNILRHTEADYIFFNANRVDLNNKVISVFSHKMHPGVIEDLTFSADAVLRQFSKHMLWLRLFRRDFIGATRFPVGITHEDIHFDMLLLARRPRILPLDKTFYRHYFDNPDSITNTMNPTKHRHVMWVYHDLYEKFRSDETLAPLMQEFISAAIPPLVSRSCYMLSTNLPQYEKLTLFAEYAGLIRALTHGSDHVPKIHVRCLEGCLFYLVRTGRIRQAYQLGMVNTFISSLHLKLVAALKGLALVEL